MVNQPINPSLKTIFSVTWPIVLLTLASYLMITTDRLILANNSLAAMNAVAISGNLVAIITGLIITLAATSEIFVGQYNGAKLYQELAAPTWQMLYFVLGTCLILWPLAYFSDVINYLPVALKREGIAYQRILLSTAFLPALAGTFASFFVGQGKGNTVTAAVVMGCIANLILDYWFVYKLKWSARGAAIASVIAYLTQVIWMATHFFSKNNRLVYATLTNHQWRPKLTWEILKVGFPTAIGTSLLMFCWWIIQTLISHASLWESTLYNLGISFHILLIFLSDALSRATTTLASNMISQNNLEGIRLTYRRFLIIVSLFIIFILVLFISFKNPILNWIASLHPELGRFRNQIYTVFILVFLNSWLESYFNITRGILMAGGDTRYPIITNLFTLAVTLILPSYYLYRHQLLTSISINLLTTLYGSIISLLFFLRYRSLKWYRSLIR